MAAHSAPTSAYTSNQASYSNDCAVRDEEAAGSNPATPTIKLHVTAYSRNYLPLPSSAGFWIWERAEADLAQPTSLTSGNAPLFVGRAGAASDRCLGDGLAPEELCHGRRDLLRVSECERAAGSGQHDASACGSEERRKPLGPHAHGSRTRRQNDCRIRP